MSETVQSEFTVQDVVNEDIWLKDSKRGLTVAVEARSGNYDREIQKKITRLSEGDRISAELKSQNTLRTIWTFDNIDIYFGRD